MPFFAPWMLLGLVAAAAPVLLHLLRKRTADRVDWGAWMFLADTLKKNRRRLVINDWVLLTLRTLALTFAVVAFARPFLPEMSFFGGRGSDRDVVIVLDVSASMRLPGTDGKTAFERAREEAIELVKLAPRGTSLGLVLGDTTPVIVTASPLSSRRELIEALEDATCGNGTLDAPRTLLAAGEVLAAGNNPTKEVVVFGDGQAYGWHPQDDVEWKRVEQVFSRFRRRPPIVWRTLEKPAKVRNAAIAELVPSRRFIGTDLPVRFTATVVNSGSETFSPGAAVVKLDGEEIVRVPLGQIMSGLSRSFQFSCAFPKPGRHVLETSLTEPDDIRSDSLVTNAVEVIDSVEVLLVNGRPAATGYDRPTAFLEAALRPELKGTNATFLVKPRVVRAGELDRESVFGKAAVTVLCDVPRLTPKALLNLKDFVEKDGRGLLVLPGERSANPFYSDALFAHPVTNWNAAVENVAFDGAPVYGRFDIDEKSIAPSAAVPFRFSDGAAAAVVDERGKGLSAVTAFPFELDATAYPARPEFVPFVHEFVLSLTGTNSLPAAGEERWRAREGDLKALEPDEADRLGVFIDLAFARSQDDVLSAVVGKSFGVEVWRTFAVLALLCVLVELALLRRLDAERGAARSRLRFALRAVALMTLGWMLLHLTLAHDVTRKIHRRVAVFTDVSKSMTVSNRLEVATNLSAAVAEKLARRYDVEPFAFGGNVTDFAAALERALAAIPSDELAGAVLLTDGRSAGGADVDAPARRFARLGAKVSTVLIGDVTNRADAAVVELAAQENLFLGDRMTAVAKLTAKSLKGRKLVVRLFDGDRELEKRELDVDADDWTKDVRFQRELEGKGVRRYCVKLDPVEGDLESRNDEWPFEVSVSDDRTNVLVAERRPRWEFRYLRNLFHARDKSVHLQYVLTEPDRFLSDQPQTNVVADAGRAFGDSEAALLPVGRDAWRKFDVIVLGDLPRTILDDRRLEDIRWCVEERGALLVAIAGERHFPADYAASPIAPLLPAVFTNEEGAVTARWKSQPTAFALTPSGLSHPVTAVAATQSETERVWASLPPARGRLAGLTPATGAETLVFAADSGALAAPLVMVKNYGRGKVMMLATDDTWHLRYRKGDLYHHRFWGNLVRWGAGEKLRDGNRCARVGTASLHYRPDARVRIVARISDRDKLPMRGLKPVVEVKGPDGAKRELDMVDSGEANGYYEACYDRTGAKGRYTAMIRCDEAEAQLGSDWPTPLVTSFDIDDGIAPVEFARPAADPELVGKMAVLTGGDVVAPEDVDKLNDAFGAAKSEITEYVEEAIWDHPAAMVAFLLSLILLWILRKRGGLA